MSTRELALLNKFSLILPGECQTFKRAMALSYHILSYSPFKTTFPSHLQLIQHN
jgi:hypothetical protein